MFSDEILEKNICTQVKLDGVENVNEFQQYVNSDSRNISDTR